MTTAHSLFVPHSNHALNEARAVHEDLFENNIATLGRAPQTAILSPGVYIATKAQAKQYRELVDDHDSDQTHYWYGEESTSPYVVIVRRIDSPHRKRRRTKSSASNISCNESDNDSDRDKAVTEPRVLDCRSLQQLSSVLERLSTATRSKFQFNTVKDSFSSVQSFLDATETLQQRASAGERFCALYCERANVDDDVDDLWMLLLHTGNSAWYAVWCVQELDISYRLQAALDDQLGVKHRLASECVDVAKHGPTLVVLAAALMIDKQMASRLEQDRCLAVWAAHCLPRYLSQLSSIYQHSEGIEEAEVFLATLKKEQRKKG